MALVEALSDEALGTPTGADPRAPAYYLVAWVLALQGFADQAAALLQRARSLKSLLQPTISRGYLHLLCAHVGMHLADSAAVANDAAALAEVARRHNLRMLRGFASCYFAWVALQQGRPEEAIAKYGDGLAELASSGTKSMVSLLCADRAIALAACERMDEAERVIEEIIKDAHGTGYQSCTAELWRVRGERSTTSGPVPPIRKSCRSLHFRSEAAQCVARRTPPWRVKTRELEKFAMELRCRHRAGGNVWVALHCSHFSEPCDSALRLIIQVQDISARRKAEQDLHDLAFTDILTDLPNRRRFQDLLAQAVDDARVDPAQRFAVLFLDFDRFKLINDSLGHSAGDEFLVHVTRRVQRCLRPHDVVARFGGDECHPDAPVRQRRVHRAPG